MLYLVKGIFGAAAISLTLGAVQFASGSNLINPLQALSANPAAGINRAAKADRAAVAAAPVPARTVSFQPEGLDATSVLVRIPLRQEARGPARTPTVLFRSGQEKPAVACEPMVSVLTEVAKRLQPGRCVT